MNPTAIPDAWRYIPQKEINEAGAQIDLLFDRRDGAINLCEIKYTAQPFVIDKSYAMQLKNKMEVFIKKTKTNKQIFLTFISAQGLKPTLYSEELVSQVVTLDDFFS